MQRTFFHSERLAWLYLAAILVANFFAIIE
jgi:hypothetical protein